MEGPRPPPRPPRPSLRRPSPRPRRCIELDPAPMRTNHPVGTSRFVSQPSGIGRVPVLISSGRMTSTIPGICQAEGGVDAEDQSVGVRAPHHRRMQHPRPAKIGDVFAAPAPAAIVSPDARTTDLGPHHVGLGCHQQYVVEPVDSRHGDCYAAGPVRQQPAVAALGETACRQPPLLPIRRSRCWRGSR